MDILKAMRVFVRIVEAGSLTAAAEGFDFSPTMVGNHLQSLEAHLGAKLLHRTTRRQTLTEFGKAYYDRCLEILALIEDAETLAQVEQAAFKGVLRITRDDLGECRSHACAQALHARISRYRGGSHHHRHGDRFPRKWGGGGHSLGVPRVTNMTVKALRPYGHVLCAAPAYLKDRAAPVSLDDLRHHDCLAFRFTPASEWWTPIPSWRLGKGPGTDEVVEAVMSPRLKADNTYALRTAVLDGMGIALMPQILVVDDIRAGRLIPVLPDNLPPPRPVNLIYRRDRRMSPRLKSFVEFALENFGLDADQVGTGRVRTGRGDGD